MCLPFPSVFLLDFTIIPSNLHPSCTPYLPSNLPPPPPLRWEAVQLSVAQLPEEVRPERWAGATPQHAPEEPYQAPASPLNHLVSTYQKSSCKHLGYICLYLLSLVWSRPGDPICTRGTASTGVIKDLLLLSLLMRMNRGSWITGPSALFMGCLRTCTVTFRMSLHMLSVEENKSQEQTETINT